MHSKAHATLSEPFSRTAMPQVCMASSRRPCVPSTDPQGDPEPPHPHHPAVPQAGLWRGLGPSPGLVECGDLVPKPQPALDLLAYPT